MKQKSLIKNAIYNFMYTGLNILFPLITAPYISRVLGAANLGKVNFAHVVANWFVLFAIFGTNTYGVREVAKVRDNRDKLDNIFSEIFIINGTLSLVAFFTYFVAIYNIERFNSEHALFSIMALSIILNVFNIDWFFQGIENYRYITVRSLILKIVSLLCIFTLIRKPEHYVLYGLISVGATSLSGILNFLHSRKFVKLQFKSINPFKHFKNLSIFFLITFIINIYTNLDQLLLGFWIDNKSVAFMNRSKSVIAIAISMSTAILNVTLPRASYYINNDKEKYQSLLSEVPNYILWIVIPITVGCICLASNIMYILGGKEFLDSASLLKIMSLTIIFSPLSTYLQSQVLVASGREKVGLYCATITSSISLILNILLIPSIGILGAGIVQVISELSAVGSRYFIVKTKLKFTQIRFINKSSISYITAALLMGSVVIFIRNLINNLFISFIFSIFIGAVVYIMVLFIIRENVTVLVIEKLKQRFSKNYRIL